jgi:hypothetical protein
VSCYKKNSNLFATTHRSTKKFTPANEVIDPNEKDVNLMPSIDVATPVSSAPSDRLALGVGWVRPGVAGIGGTLNPALGSVVFCRFEVARCFFEGNEE